MGTFLNLAFRGLRVLPVRLRGKVRLGRLLAGLMRPKEQWIPAPFGIRLKVPDVRESIALSLLVDGIYDPDLFEFLLKFVPRGGIYVDIGANVGSFALPLAKHVRTSGTVVAVEASPRMFGILEGNITENGIKNIVPIWAAISDVDGMVKFYEAPRERFGMGCLARVDGWESSSVAARTLDSVLKDLSVSRIDVLKIDVEGFEASVLRGASDLLKSATPPIVVFEFCDWAEANSGLGVGAAQEELRSIGYQVYLLQEFMSAGRPLDRVVREGMETLVARLPTDV